MTCAAFYEFVIRVIDDEAVLNALVKVNYLTVAAVD